jgi:GNAT superfamily N-acetyltransferase
MIRRCADAEFEEIHAIINDGALAYKGVIPEDCFAEPYMSRDELAHELAAGVRFWGFEDDGKLSGVMGIQRVQDVTLIRHAYVRTSSQRKGIGTHLLAHLQTLTKTPVLIGTWRDAAWAIRFYQKHGFRLLRDQQGFPLMKRYWSIPQRQLEVSVVLADAAWQK